MQHRISQQTQPENHELYLMQILHISSFFPPRAGGYALFIVSTQQG